MKNIVKRGLIASVICIIGGIFTLACALLMKETMTEELFSYLIGFTVGLLLVGIAVFIRNIIAIKNLSLAQKLENEANDERLISIDDKAKSITLVVCVLVEVAISIINAIIGNAQISQYAAIFMIFQACVYLASFLILKKIK